MSAQEFPRDGTTKPRAVLIGNGSQRGVTVMSHKSATCYPGSVHDRRVAWSLRVSSPIALFGVSVNRPNPHLSESRDRRALWLTTFMSEP